MKVLIALGFLCLLQVIAGQITKDVNKVPQHNPGGQLNKPGNQAATQVSGQQDKQSNQNNENNNKAQQVDGHNVIQQHVVPQHVAGQHVIQQHVVPQQVAGHNVIQQHVVPQQFAQQQANVHVKPQHNSKQSKVTVEVPPKVQQVVTQVSQHIPQVVNQHVANKQRMMRSTNWQDMQVDPIEKDGKCEFICNKEDVSVCGYNGRCYWEFESQCDLSVYNCLNTQKIFQVADFVKCKESGAPKCYRGDM